MMFSFGSALSLFAGVLVLEGLRLLWDNRKQKKSIIDETPDAEVENVRIGDGLNINTALFFPESELPCKYLYKLGQCFRKNCEFSHDAKVLTCLLTYLRKAKKTLDICVYMITSHELRNEILNMDKRGISIRVITDGTFGDEDRTIIRDLRAKGIAIRSNLPAARLLMHHKFAIVDDMLLINGSFNWTWQAITGNHENVLVTTNPRLVTPYINEFKRLWEDFNPSRQTELLQYD